MSWRRAAGVVAVALVVAAGCSLAGVWQWTRHEDRSAAAALVEANYDADPVPIEDLVADGLRPDEVWRPATVRGTYVASVVLRNRPVSGTPAAHALGVLEVSQGPLDGRLLVVDRGWFPAAEAATGRRTPTGDLDVLVRLRPGEPPADRDAPPGQVQAIAVEQVLGATGLARGRAVADVYGVLADESGGSPAGVTPLPRPDVGLGPHLSYAFQWWVFAVGALVGAAVLLRREAATVGPAAPPEEVGVPASPAARRPARRRRPTAEDEEDALLDAAERRTAAERGPADGSVSPRS